MANAYITDLRHVLNPDGSPPPSGPRDGWLSILRPSCKKLPLIYLHSFQSRFTNQASALAISGSRSA
jgi:hypothetical protein